MRITKIRIAGFKSFVDPTTLHLPGNLTGVVGPNGCGKSNIIDAVLWVLGESSARHLRGDSMADVVFNGSSTRKPVGVASVEIIFDNSDGLIGGAYAAFGEISVRRTVNREGISSYFLNSTRCRRLDITNLFLGTGVGARSYAVIEQGMISRVVEARPEELRLFLEEAAGISKYKVRRKDTEHRVHNTRENLARLDDIRGELERQLGHLQQQARAAERYQELRQEERLQQRVLLALRLRRLMAELDALSEAVGARMTAVEAETAGLRGIEAEVTTLRSHQAEAGERFSEVQRRYYQAGATISRLEQSLAHLRETRARLEAQLRETRATVAALAQERAADSGKLEAARSARADLAPAFAVAQAAEEAAVAALARAEQAHDAWQVEWDRFREQAAEAARHDQLAQARIDHLEGGLVELRHRVERLEEEKAVLEGLKSLTDEPLDAALAEAHAALDAAEARHAAAQERIRTLRDEAQALAVQLDASRTSLQTVRGRSASLDALHRAALGRDDEDLTRTLVGAGLAEAPRLAARIQVEPGWEWALEVVLALPLESLCVEDLLPALTRVATIESGSVALVAADRHAVARAAGGVAGCPSLADRLLASSPVDDLLASVGTVESLEQARDVLPRLVDGQSVVTREGIWLGRGWARIRRPRSTQSPLLEQERTLRALRREAAQLEQEVAVSESRLVAAHEALRVAEHTAEVDALSARRAAEEHLSRLRSERAARAAERQQVLGRLERIDVELERLAAQMRDDDAERSGISARLERSAAEAEVREVRRDALAGQRDCLREEVQRMRERWLGTRGEAHRIELELREVELRAAQLGDALDRSARQQADLLQRESEIGQQLADGTAPEQDYKVELDAALAQRLAVESQLAAARTSLQDIDGRIRAEEQARHAAEARLAEARASLESARVEQRALEVRATDLRAQIEAAGHDPATSVAELRPEAGETECEAELERLARRIQRLGPINLAAIGEYQQLAERKNYLDAQHADLSEALATLDAAMQKIDRETRTRFRETFDRVNAGLQVKFPLLFGGGHAYLELSGDDLLETGVTVMARPPGKRNGTIHLLSGGEKALTAVALVFAIFDLNPAPFCLLDEVDAPLDDANVVRLCQMIKSMAGQIQFLFVTHNKVTMELAHQLIGVTMQEPGVSRLVAVDVDEAVQLAATA